MTNLPDILNDIETIITENENDPGLKCHIISKYIILEDALRNVADLLIRYGDDIIGNEIHEDLDE